MDANHGVNPVKDTVVEPPKTPLPEPDKDNITVLTSKLPNEPILPWNRYDSPWLESAGGAEASETVTDETVVASEAGVAEAEASGVATQETEAQAATAPPEPSASRDPSIPLSPTPAGEIPVGERPAGERPAGEVTDEATTDDTLTTPLPATNHYLIDLAFEGTTD
ncbi:hypothetical protein [Trichothermofontia sp.]